MITTTVLSSIPDSITPLGHQWQIGGIVAVIAGGTATVDHPWPSAVLPTQRQQWLLLLGQRWYNDEGPKLELITYKQFPVIIEQIDI